MRFSRVRTRVQFGLLLLVTFSFSCVSRADVIEFRLTGNAGDGLLPGNVTPPTGVSGSGAAGLSSITFDTATNILHIDVEWGSGNGYGDLTGNVTLLHLHGPTNDPAPDSFSQTGPLLITLSNSLNFNSSATNGGMIDNFFLANQNISHLMQGRLYINVHTDVFPMGEIRGYLVAVPEPGSAIACIAFVVFAGIRRRRR